MSQVETVLAELGETLPETPKPVAAYIPAVRTGDLVYTSGQLPTRGGSLVGMGLLGKHLPTDEGRMAARVACLNALAAIKSVIGELDHVEQVVKLTVYVASDPSFTEQPLVANGASELLQQAFGDRGRHARAAVGCASLPLNAPVEVELIVRVSS